MFFGAQAIGIIITTIVSGTKWSFGYVTTGTAQRELLPDSSVTGQAFAQVAA